MPAVDQHGNIILDYMALMKRSRQAASSWRSIGYPDHAENRRRRPTTRIVHGSFGTHQVPIWSAVRTGIGLSSPQLRSDAASAPIRGFDRASSNQGIQLHRQYALAWTLELR